MSTARVLATPQLGRLGTQDELRNASSGLKPWKDSPTPLERHRDLIRRFSTCLVLVTGLFVPDRLLARSPEFQRVAAPPGCPAGRAQLIDVDQDGWPDLCVCGENAGERGSYRVFLNRERGGGGFVEATEATGLAGGLKSFLVWGDLNNDGCLDCLAVARQNAAEYAQSPASHQVYLGDGHGHYHPLDKSGLERPEFCNTLGAVLSDLDLDGRLDAAFANAYVDEGKGLEAQQMRVYSGSEGQFTEVTEAWGFLTPGPPGAANGGRPLYGITAADLNNDGYPELLGAAYGRQWNTLWMRSPKAPFYSDCAAKYGVDGDAIRHGRYTEATREKFKKRGEERPDELPFRSNGNNFCLAPADYDGDGDIDLFSAVITHSWAGDSSDLSALLINRLEKFHEPFFERRIEQLPQPDPETGFAARPLDGLARDHSPQPHDNWNQGDLQAYWADLDQDGLLDLIICESDYPNNHLRVFLQTPDHKFREAEHELGLDWPNCPGVALGDFDRNGSIDLVATGTNTRWPQARPKAEISLWKNTPPAQNGFLWVRLIGDGRGSNRNAIGARLFLTTDQGQQCRELTGPYGHWGQESQPDEANFGLGTAKPLSLRIVWPDKQRSETVVNGLSARSWVVVEQGVGAREKMSRFDGSRWAVKPSRPK